MSDKKKRIFVVDDDLFLSMMLSDHLEQNPMHEVHVYNTGEEGLANLHLKPNVVILDYHLNSVDEDAEDGVFILQKIKALDESVCVIMLSSQTELSSAVETIVKGALEYVTKDDNAFAKIDEIISRL